MRLTRFINTLACSFVLLIALGSQNAQADEPVTSEEARAIAKEAYVYANPVADSYRIVYSYFVDSADSDYKAPWNQIKNISRVYTHEDRAVQTPNSDTPYSWLALDLRTEPSVLTVPPIDEGRYFSIEFFDLYSHAVDYIGTRTTGNDGGQFLLAGPGWEGNIPGGITKTYEFETELMLKNNYLYRMAAAVFTASETFDVGMDLCSPVADDYFDKSPFKFEGTLKKLHFKYLEQK